MKKIVMVSAIAALLMVLIVVPSSAQLGDIGNASFTVQNVGGATATVSVTFVDENGVESAPNPLNLSKANPFDLAAGESFEVVVADIPSLAAGRYSVIISSTQEVVAIVNLIGKNAAATTYYNGSYSGASMGASPVYLPAFWYRKYGWNSLISIQNTGTGDANVTVNFTCLTGQTGSLSKNGLKKGAAVHFDLETTPVSGLPVGGCGGSAVITSSQPVVVVDNQSTGGGLTQSLNTFDSGAGKVYVPALYNDYYTWDSSLNIVKIGSGTSNVTVAYSDGGSASCALTDGSPSCLLLLDDRTSGDTLFGATITATGQPVVAISNAANPNSQAQTYGGFASGSDVVGLPTTMKSYYSWYTSFTCQNIGSVPTALGISYQPFKTFTGHAYDTAGTLAVSESIEIRQADEAFLPNGYRGSVTVTAKAAGGEIACIVNSTSASPAGGGDWSMSYNAQ